MAGRRRNQHLLVAVVIAAVLGTAAAAIVEVQPIQINQAATKVTPTYTWTIEKAFTNGPDTQALTFDVATGGAASYRVVATKTLQRQVVSVAGSFDLRSTADPTVSNATTHPFQTPTLTFPAATGGVQSQVQCSPAGAVPDGGVSTCTFTATWTDTSIMAASGGSVTVNVISNEDMAQSTQTQSYSMAASTGNAPGDCATVSDSFSSGDITESMVSVQGSRPPAGGIQTCNLGPTEYSYTVTFQNLDPTLCSRPISAINTASLRVDGQAFTQSDSATATITLTGCQGASVTVGSVQTTVINSYTWALTKTGGGSGLTTTPDQELSVPFTIAATQTLVSTVGYVSGTITVQNTVGATVAISGLTVSVGGQAAATVPVSDCSTTSLVGKGASASCKFNVTDPAAPAAGTVTATVTISGGTTATSTAANYDYQTASTFNIGGTANVYDTVNEQALNQGTISVATNGVAVTTTPSGNIRFDPPDQRPPSTAPGLSIGGSRTFQYNMIIAKLLRCTNELTVTNTVTLVPGQGSTQGSQTASASLSFRVTGCDVLPAVSVTNLQSWSAVTWSWAIQKTALTNQVQVSPGQGGTAQYQVVLTRNFQTGNYWLSGTLVVQNPAAFPMYISSVQLQSSTGQFGAMPQTCLGGSNVGTANPNPNLNNGGLNTGMPQGFVLSAGNQINCVFNVSAGTGSPVAAQVTASVVMGTGSFVGSGGNTAFSPQMAVDFNSPTQQWNIGDCVTLTDSATVTGMAGTYVPQVTGLPNQQRFCNSQTVPYSAVISPVPITGATCNTPITINNNAVATPIGGGTTGTLQSSATTQIIVTGCQSPSPAPAPAPIPPPANLPLVATVSPAISAVSAGNYRWTVALSNSANDAATVPYSSTKAVQYTVTAKRIAPTDGTNTVSGTITVSNPNAAAVAVTAVTVSIAGTATPTAADCGSAVTVPAGGTITCSFSIQVASTAAGSVTASAASAVGPGTPATPVPFSFDATGTQGAQGRCAVITDAFTPAPILQGALTVTNNRPADGTAPIVCDDTTYTFSAVFGPFKATDCNLYPVGATATVTPQNGPQAQAPATAQDVLQLTVDSCPGSILSNTGVTAVVNPPTTSSVVSYEWVASTVAVDYNTKVAFKDTGAIQYNLTWALLPTATSTLAGTVTVTNPTDNPVTIKSVTVEPEGAVGSTAGAIPAVTATCAQTEVAPGASTTCSYKSVSSATGRGVVVAEVALDDGTGTTSVATPFSFEAAATTKATGSDVCAEIIGGMALSSALLQPGAATANPADTFQVCEAGSKIYSQPVGPFKDNQCGQYMVTLLSRIRPLRGGQAPFASIAPALLQVRECSLTVTPSPAVAIAPTLTATNVVAFSWKLSKTSNLTGDTLVVSPYNSPAVVQVTTSATRNPGRRSASVQGTVQLQAQGKSDTTVTKVQAAALSRTGELVIVDATCPAAAIQNGLITVPAGTSKLQCAFKIDNLTPMDGAVVPLVYGDRGADTPMPTNPGVWKFAGAARDTQGDCATFGASASLTKKGATGADAVVQGQPVRQGANFPSTPVCSTSSTTYTLTFGPFKATQCGSYRFDSDLSADLVNSPVFETTELNFDVTVQGCRKRKRSRLL